MVHVEINMSTTTSNNVTNEQEPLWFITITPVVIITIMIFSINHLRYNPHPHRGPSTPAVLRAILSSSCSLSHRAGTVLTSRQNGFVPI